MNTIRRFAIWTAHNTVFEDCLRALALMLLAYTSVANYEQGLWHIFSPNWQRLWSFILLIPIILRRRYPEGSTYAFAGLVIMQVLIGPDFVFSDLLAPVMLYSAIIHGNRKRSNTYIMLAFFVGLIAALIITWNTEINVALDPEEADDGENPVYLPCHVGATSIFNTSCASKILQTFVGIFLLLSVILAAACFMAYWTRSRRTTAQLLRERNSALAARKEEELTIARTAERARIARDMHDVVAHTLSTIIIQSDAGRYAGSNNPAAARTIMQTIADESLKAQHDMEGLLGTFGGVPYSGYEQIDGLITQGNATARSTGGCVRRTIHGTPQPERFSDNAQSAAFRTVQEALTNARKYAGEGVDITVTEIWETSGLRLRIRDNGNGSAAAMDGHHPGFGLMGMNERLRTIGGSVEAGPGIDGGFIVDATLPFDDETLTSPQTTDTGTIPVQDEASTTPDPSPQHPTSADLEASAVLDPATSQRALAAQTAKQEAFNRDKAEPRPRMLLQSARQRSQRSMHNTPAAQLNWVERISGFFATHYVLSDTLSAAFISLVWRILSHGFSTEPNISRELIPTDSLAWITLTLIAFTAIALRRRFPQSAALAMLFAAFAALLFCTDMKFPYIVYLAPISLHCVCLYGQGRSRQWSIPAAFAGCMLFAARYVASMDEYLTLFDVILGHRIATTANATITDYAMNSVAIMFASFAVCLAAIGSALWTRARDTNAIVLESRREAMEEEFAKQQILAANSEREHVSAEIRGTINETLSGVIKQANNGLALLDTNAKAGTTPSPESINKAFGQIGEEGRAALADMRQLLRMLRETGGSDNDRAIPQAPLHPVDVPSEN